MNKLSVSLKNIDLGEDWTTHPLIEWLSSNKKIFFGAFLALLMLLVLTYRLTTIRTLKDESDFFQAQTAFTQFQKNSLSSPDSPAQIADFEQLNAIMQRHPELKPKYEGPLAQTLLIVNQIPQAQTFTSDIFQRTQADHLQFYQTYSQISLLIGEGHYSDALKQTQQLKSTLDERGEMENPFLYVFNLIRLGMLYQQIGQTQEELQVWEGLQNQPQRREAVIAANQLFKVGQASLEQYIEERKKILTPEKK